MDPNVTLADIRRELDLAERAPSLAHANVHRENACTAMRGLDAWISNGGFFPSQWLEAQRTALENTRVPAGLAPPAQPTRCEETTLAGTTVTVPCPEPEPDALTVNPRYDRRVGRRPLPSGPYGAGAISAGEAVSRKLRGDC